MSVGSHGLLQLEIGVDQVEHCMYVAPQLLSVDFLQKHRIQLHDGAGELRVGSSLTIYQMPKGAPPWKELLVTVRRVRLSPLSVGVVECTAQGEHRLHDCIETT
jgi:hypothetical protein